MVRSKIGIFGYIIIRALADKLGFWNAIFVLFGVFLALCSGICILKVVLDPWSIFRILGKLWRRAREEFNKV